MKKNISRSLCTPVVILAAFFVTLFCVTPVVASVAATSLSVRLRGRILLQVESRGEAWYISPVDSRRYSLGTPANAFAVMRSLGLGVTNRDLAKIPIAGDARDGDRTLTQRLLGRILLQVESRGEAWYISPVDSRR